MLRLAGMLGASRRLAVAGSAIPRRLLSNSVPAWARPATFVEQHVGPSPAQREQMLKSMGFSSMQSFVEATVPASLLSSHQLQVGEPLSEQEALAEFTAKISLNQSGIKSLIGQGYHGVVTPAVLQSRLLEDASWYTPYTPYQAEIAQGRLEMLLNYQTMIVELTGMQVHSYHAFDFLH
jgi:glycine dehydrogenase